MPKDLSNYYATLAKKLLEMTRENRSFIIDVLMPDMNGYDL